MDASFDPALVRELFKLRGAEFSRCFAFPPLCDEPPIRAHSVQNARILDLLVRDGHVVAPTFRLDPSKGVLIELSLVGRNRATTFAGVCADHDQAIFAPIDNQPLHLSSAEHLFLLAYKAVFFEVHATAAAGVMTQSMYRKRVDLGHDSGTGPSPAGLMATERLIVAHDTFMYKTRFDELHAKCNFSGLVHDVVHFDTSEPTIAASSLFELPSGGNARGEHVRVCLTVLPLSVTETVAIFSFLPEDAGIARASLTQVLSATGDHQKYELSRLLLNHSSNWVLSPAYVDRWTPEKRALVTTFFTNTIGRDGMDTQHKDLFLF